MGQIGVGLDNSKPGAIVMGLGDNASIDFAALILQVSTGSAAL